MTITIMTNATMTCSAIKPSVSNMSNIRKSVSNIQHTKHISSAIAAILITYDKHPPLIIVVLICYLTIYLDSFLMFCTTSLTNW